VKNDRGPRASGDSARAQNQDAQSSRGYARLRAFIRLPESRESRDPASRNSRGSCRSTRLFLSVAGCGHQCSHRDNRGTLLRRRFGRQIDERLPPRQDSHRGCGPVRTGAPSDRGRGINSVGGAGAGVVLAPRICENHDAHLGNDAASSISSIRDGFSLARPPSANRLIFRGVSPLHQTLISSIPTRYLSRTSA
jgi:hypothetical protein